MPNDDRVPKTTVVRYEEPDDIAVPVTVTGNGILLKMFVASKKIGMIYRPDESKDREDLAAVLGKVVQLGDDCYPAHRKFKNQWCKAGDYVLIQQYAGSRFKFSGEEYRVINDDQVVAIIHDPEAVSRA